MFVAVRLKPHRARTTLEAFPRDKKTRNPSRLDTPSEFHDVTTLRDEHGCGIAGLERGIVHA